MAVHHADKALSPYDVLVDVSLRARAGSTTAVVAPFSMGATTLVQAMLGMLGLDAGRIIVGGLSVTEADYGEIQRLQRDSGVLLLGGRQHGASVLSDRTVAQSLRRALDAADLSPAVIDERVADQLVAFGLTDVADQPLSETSRGVARRAALARVLVTRPGLIVLDEPGAGLGEQDRAELLATLCRTRATTDATVVIATTDLALVHALADEIVLLRHGGSSCRGSSATDVAAGRRGDRPSVP